MQRRSEMKSIVTWEFVGSWWHCALYCILPLYKVPYSNKGGNLVERECPRRLWRVFSVSSVPQEDSPQRVFCWVRVKNLWNVLARPRVSYQSDVQILKECLAKLPNNYHNEHKDWRVLDFWCFTKVSYKNASHACFYTRVWHQNVQNKFCTKASHKMSCLRNGIFQESPSTRASMDFLQESLMGVSHRSSYCLREETACSKLSHSVECKRHSRLFSIWCFFALLIALLI